MFYSIHLQLQKKTGGSAGTLMNDVCGDVHPELYPLYIIFFLFLKIVVLQAL